MAHSAMIKFRSPTYCTTRFGHVGMRETAAMMPVDHGKHADIIHDCTKDIQHNSMTVDSSDDGGTALDGEPAMSPGQKLIPSICGV
jgi:hypothetical protein